MLLVRSQGVVMSSDKERIHRWITQAELERMLADAYRHGAEAMREAAADAGIEGAADGAPGDDGGGQGRIEVDGVGEGLRMQGG